jgi:hypothetical protein
MLSLLCFDCYLEWSLAVLLLELQSILNTLNLLWAGLQIFVATQTSKFD